MTARTLLLTCALALAACGCQGEPEPALPPPPELLGRWRDEIESYGTVEFRRDGTVLVDDRNRERDGRYWVLARNRVVIDVYGRDRAEEYIYLLRGDRLTLEPVPASATAAPAAAHRYARAK